MNRLIAILVLLSFAAASGCYYDNEEFLYPQTTGGGCDTTAVSYSQRLVPILNAKCITCHNASLPSGNIGLTSHADVAASIDLIIPAIEHTGPHPMPQGAPKLPACEILSFVAWRNNGALNN